MNQNHRASKQRFIEEKIRLKMIYLLFLFIMPLIAIYLHIQTRDEVLNSFITNKEFVCKVGNLKVNVSKKDNWIYEDYYFIKDETKIVTTKCEDK